MHLFFLIPLTTSLVAGYLFKKSADEMAYLTGLITIVSLILSLALAPWQLQLLILMLVIISTRRLLLQNQYGVELEESKEEKQLLSRVNEKPAPPSAKATKGEIAGKYRGASYVPTHPKAKVTNSEMAGKYRGNPW